MAGKEKQEVGQHVAQRQPRYGAKELTMSPITRYVKTPAKARQCCRLKAQERLERDRHQAQRAAEALEDLGLPTELAAEIEGRLRSQQQLLGKICGVMLPPLFGCRTNSELCRRQPIPTFLLPLKPEDREPTVDMGGLLHDLHDRAGYDLRLDYTDEPQPPLPAAVALWAEQLLRQKGLR